MRYGHGGSLDLVYLTSTVFESILVNTLVDYNDWCRSGEE